MTDFRTTPIQDVMQSQCFGCGAQNEHGFQIKSTWDGEVGRCVWTPEPYHCAVPGMLYGGIIASLIDCHLAVTLTAAAYEAEGREIGSDPRIAFVTANLNIDYLKPTSSQHPVELVARVESLEGRRGVASCDFFSQDQRTAHAQGTFVRVQFDR